MGFQSTPSARRATDDVFPDTTIAQISIHALREESDMFLALLLILVFYFNPRPPRGERLGDKVPVIVKAKISIHALREESD